MLVGSIVVPVTVGEKINLDTSFVD